MPSKAKINELWQINRDSLLEQSSIIVKKLNNIQNSIKSNQSLNKNLLDDTFKRFSNRYDDTFGGFGKAPGELLSFWDVCGPLNTMFFICCHSKDLFKHSNSLWGCPNRF